MRRNADEQTVTTLPAWAAVEARRRHVRTLRTIRVPVTAVGVIASVLGIGLMVLHPGTASGFAVGSTWASIAWAVSMIVVESSGTAPKLMSVRAEEWTRQELKALQRTQWRVFHGILLERSDVDHVAFGPKGAFVLETKWSATPWASADPRFEKFAAQARTNAKAIALRLGANGHREAPSPVVVLWGEDERHDQRSIVGGVPVVHGSDLVAWLLDHAKQSSASVDVNQCAGALESYDAKRVAEQRRRHPLSRFEEVGVYGMVWDVYLGVVAALLTLLAVSLAWTALPPAGSILLPLALGVGTWFARRRSSLATAALGVRVTSLAMTVVYAALWTVLEISSG